MHLLASVSLHQKRSRNLAWIPLFSGMTSRVKFGLTRIVIPAQAGTHASILPLALESAR